MIYKTHYKSPVGDILLVSKNNKLIGLWIEGQKHYLENINEEVKENRNEEILIKTKTWLDKYFKGLNPNINELNLEPIGSEFRQMVWKILCQVPYGKTITYNMVAREVANQKGIEKVSARAVGTAIGHNPISIIIPCHRVVGTDGSLTGYAGGLDIKIKLLKLEKCDFSNLYDPRNKDLNKKRCKWCNLKNELYIKYHDEEWCNPNFDEQYLYEMLILESFQAGLSWECILNKRENFREAYDYFDIDKVINYDDKKIEELLSNKNIIRNKLKIKASINNSKIFKDIQKEYGSFYNYLKSFTNGKIIYEIDKTTSSLSDNISNDLQKRGMRFVGSTIIYSYLQAIGIIFSHEKECYLYREN